MPPNLRSKSPGARLSTSVANVQIQYYYTKEEHFKTFHYLNAPFILKYIHIYIYIYLTGGAQNFS